MLDDGAPHPAFVVGGPQESEVLTIVSRQRAGDGIFDEPVNVIRDDERPCRWRAVVIPHPQHQLHCGTDVEQNRHIVPVADVLCPLTDVEAECRLPLAHRGRVHLEHGVLEAQARQMR